MNVGCKERNNRVPCEKAKTFDNEVRNIVSCSSSWSHMYTYVSTTATVREIIPKKSKWKHKFVFSNWSRMTNPQVERLCLHNLVYILFNNRKYSSTLVTWKVKYKQVHEHINKLIFLLRINPNYCIFHIIYAITRY